MEQTFKEKTELLVEHISDFLETKKDLALVNASIIGTNIASSVILFLLIFIFLAIFIIFAAVALAYWLGAMLQSLSLGFLATGLLFFIFGAICLILKNKILIPIKNVIVNLIYDKN